MKMYIYYTYCKKYILWYIQSYALFQLVHLTLAKIGVKHTNMEGGCIISD